MLEVKELEFRCFESQSLDCYLSINWISCCLGARERQAKPRTSPRECSSGNVSS